MTELNPTWMDRGPIERARDELRALERGALRDNFPEYLPIPAVWTHGEPPYELSAAGPAVRVCGSIDHPGEFVFQIRAMGQVVSARLDDGALAELHRQAMAVRRSPAGGTNGYVGRPTSLHGHGRACGSR